MSGRSATKSSVRGTMSRTCFPFENRGVEVGVTLHHPHGQIYAYPFVPPIAARELFEQRRYFDAHGRGLLEDHLRAEERDGPQRFVYAGSDVVALVPVCARYPYEVWVAPRRGAPSLAALTQEERADFARALKTVLLKYDGLWKRPFPYIMVFHQAPTDGAAASGGARPRRVLSSLPDAEPAEVPRRQRDRRRRVHGRYAA